MPDRDPDGPDPDAPRPAPPLLDYTRRPAPLPDDSATAALHFVTGFALYWSLIVAMKLAAVRFQWDVGAVCGTWVLVLVVAFGVGGWLAGALGWRGAILGVLAGFVLSLLVSALILREG